MIWRSSGGRGPFAERVARRHHLADDLAGIEIAHQALRPGMAELARQGAADLGGDAERAALLLGNVDAFRLLAVGEAQEPLARAVRRAERPRRRGPRHDIAPGEVAAKFLGERSHRREIGDAAVIDPMPQLARAEGGRADRRHFGSQLRAAQSDQVLARLGRARNAIHSGKI